MEQDDSILIRPVGNGFEVYPLVDMDEMASTSPIMVFQSMAELDRFIKLYFSFRCQKDIVNGFIKPNGEGE